MSSEYGGPYILRDGDGEWVAPEPAEQVIVDEVLAATDLTPEDVEPLDEHVDFDALAELLEGEGGTLTFPIQDHDITVSSDGDVAVETE